MGEYAEWALSSCLWERSTAPSRQREHQHEDEEENCNKQKRCDAKQGAQDKSAQFPVSRVAARELKTGLRELMFVQLHGREGGPGAASEQSAWMNIVFRSGKKPATLT
jgi:hypothetical protein